MRLAAVLSSGILLACSAGGADPNEALSKELAGRYTILSGERNSLPIEEARLKDVTVEIGRNAISTFDRDNKAVYVATYKLDATKNPAQITMTAKVTPVNGEGTIAKGLIQRDQDVVKLIYALPGGETPTGFKTSRGQQMFVLSPAARK